MRLRKQILTLLVLLGAVGMQMQAQNGLNMPYAQFGLGYSEQPLNMPMALRLGGSLYTKGGSNFVNPYNPASYSEVGKESFVFDMGLSITMSRLSDGTNKQNDADGNIGHIAIAFPIASRLSIAAGLMPLTNAEYESVQVNDAEQVRTIYDGQGGVSQVFLGAGYNIPLGKWGQRHTLRVGANANLLTGHVQRAVSYSFIGNDTTYFLNSRRYRQTRLSNIVVDFGLQYAFRLNEKYSLHLGLTYKPHMSENVNDEALKYTYHTSDESLVDTIFPALGSSPNFKSKIEQAQTLGVGISLERHNRWRASADATFASWNGIRYTEDADHAIFGSEALKEGPCQRYALAFEKLNNMDAATYWGRIGWSIGLHATQGLMHLSLTGGDKQINEWGAGAGLALPMRRGKSIVNISVGYSSMGADDPLKRQCLVVGVGLSSCEKWFVQRKYN